MKRLRTILLLLLYSAVLVGLVFLGFRYKSQSKYFFCAAILWGVVLISLIRLTVDRDWWFNWAGVLWITGHIILFFSLIGTAMLLQNHLRDYFFFAAMVWGVAQLLLLPAVARKSVFSRISYKRDTVQILRKMIETLDFSISGEDAYKDYFYLIVAFSDGIEKKIFVNRKAYFEAKENELKTLVYKEKDGAILFVRFED